jgi:hypothetical protein
MFTALFLTCFLQARDEPTQTGSRYVFIVAKNNQKLPFYDIKKNNNVLPLVLRVGANGKMYSNSVRIDDFKGSFPDRKDHHFVLDFDDQKGMGLLAISDITNRILEAAPRNANVYIYVRVTPEK